MLAELQSGALAALFATARQLALFAVPFFVFALLMQGVSQLIRRHGGALFGTRCYVWLTAPGVVVHELGHAAFCLLFGHRILAISLFNPRSDGTLGYVKHSYDKRSLYQNLGNFFIGSGPLWFGSALIVVLTRLLVEPSLLAPLSSLVGSAATHWSWGRFLDLLAALPQPLVELGRGLAPRIAGGEWPLILFLYLAFAIGSHVTLSPPDLRGTLPGLALLLTGLYLLNLAATLLGHPLERVLAPLLPLLYPVMAMLLLVLVLNLLFLAVTLLFSLIKTLLRG